MQYKIINGAVYYGGDMILENINFEIRDGEKIAVVGRNGCGKTTLLKAIMGEVDIDEGTGEETFQVIKAGHPEVSYLRQVPFEDENTSMVDEVRKVFLHLIEMEEKLEQMQKAMESSADEKLIAEYSAMNDSFILLGGLTYKKEYLSMIRSFGFTDEDMEKPLSEFSGGQRTKIGFMKLLLSKPDILLLDEPTNHLDISTIRWLETYLKNYKSALVLVSHDRMFLDKTVNKVYEIEYGEMKCYRGDYTDFERQKQENHLKQQKDHDLQQAEIKRLENLIERFRYKATKAKMVQSKIKLLENMKRINAPDRYDLRTYRSHFQPRTESGKTALTVQNLSIGYEESSPLAEIKFELLRGEKLGIIGENGIGKSTFLKTLTGEIPAISGNFEFGFHTEIGYFDQQLAQITGNETLFDSFSRDYPELNDREVRTALGSFQFSGEDVFRQVSTLSGGEKVRLALCKILHSRPNVLILDEPTNHMDIVGKETLESILSEYEGTIIFVSHDRYFVRKIADRILAFENGGAQFYAESYDEYELRRDALVNGNDAYSDNDSTYKTNNTKSNISTKPRQKKTFTTPLKEKNRRLRRVEKLEALMTECDEKLAELNAAMQSPEVCSDYAKLSEIQSESDTINKQQLDYMTEWETLMQELEALESEDAE